MTTIQRMLARSRPGTPDHTSAVEAIYNILSNQSSKTCKLMAIYLKIAHLSPEGVTYPDDLPLPPGSTMEAVDYLFAANPDDRLHGYACITQTVIRNKQSEDPDD
jgi:hypothetical protein